MSVTLQKMGGKLRVEDPDRQEAARLINDAPPALRDRLTTALAGILHKKVTVDRGK